MRLPFLCVAKLACMYWLWRFRPQFPSFRFGTKATNRACSRPTNSTHAQYLFQVIAVSASTLPAHPLSADLSVIADSPTANCEKIQTVLALANLEKSSSRQDYDYRRPENQTSPSLSPFVVQFFGTYRTLQKAMNFTLSQGPQN